MKNLSNPFKKLTKFEWTLWLSSLTAIIVSFFGFSSDNYTVLISSVIGITALIFCAKGMVIGQIISVIFAIFYGIVSFFLSYYGEMITYLGMSAPIAIISVITWIKNPYKKTEQVKVREMSKAQITLMSFLAVIVTVAFYFALKALNTNQLIISTLSITTSFVPAYMMMMRNPSYPLAYAANDIVLIILWTITAISDISYVPMVVCFVLFLINDIYAFINWQRMKRFQKMMR